MKIITAVGCGLIYLLTFLANPQDDLAKSMTRGKAIYMESCITCHLGNGEGVKGTFPPLAKADFLLKYPEKSIHAIKFGIKGPIKVNGITYNNAMPPAGLENDEIADVMNYIQNSFGNKNPKLVSPKMVEAIKE
ncbi:cytochrome c [Pedobacter sp. ASV28]|uniref:c-type cytochrome n=1 Tax=Pedobacter sp. ASV28 TaxID=2795123 RepID=UPI0018ED141B|nr:cytochrome c [Pedobacter sp. ASV28]